MRFAALIIVLPLLGACAPPAEHCIADATRELRSTQAQIAQSRQIIERGYQLETRTRPDLRFGFCQSSGAVHACYRNVWITDQRRVPADIDAELAKLKVLERKQHDLTRKAQASIAQCQRLYPT